MFWLNIDECHLPPAHLVPHMKISIRANRQNELMFIIGKSIFHKYFMFEKDNVLTIIKYLHPARGVKSKWFRLVNRSSVCVCVCPIQLNCYFYHAITSMSRIIHVLRGNFTWRTPQRIDINELTFVVMVAWCRLQSMNHSAFTELIYVFLYIRIWLFETL